MTLLLLRPNGTKDVPHVPPTDPNIVTAVLPPALRVRMHYWVGSTRTSVDLSTRCSAVTASHGRTSRESAVADPGQMTLTFDNTDGLLDPDNTASALYGRFVPVGPRATTFSVDHLFEGAYRPIGHGLLDSIDRTWGPAGAWSGSVVTCVDQTAELARLIPSAGVVFGRQTSSERINLAVVLPTRTGERFAQATIAVQPSSRQLGSYVSDGNDSMWDIITRAAYADDGLVYFGPDGIMRFQSGAYRGSRGALAVLGDGGTEVEVDADLTYRLSADGVVNEAAFTTYEGAWTGLASAAGSAVVEGGNGTATQLSDRHQVLARAQHVYATYKDPRRGVEQVSLDVLAAYHDRSLASPYRLAMRLQVSDRLTLTRRPPGGGSTLTADYFVESISHTIASGEGAQWKTTLRLSPAPVQQLHFRLGLDKFGIAAPLTW